MYMKDQERFIFLFSKYTHIGKARLNSYLGAGAHNVTDIFHRPTDIAQNDKELESIENLREMRNLYDVLKAYDRSMPIKTPQVACDYFRFRFKDMQDREYFSVLFLST